MGLVHLVVEVMVKKKESSGTPKKDGKLVKVGKTNKNRSKVFDKPQKEKSNNKKRRKTKVFVKHI